MTTKERVHVRYYLALFIATIVFIEPIPGLCDYESGAAAKKIEGAGSRLFNHPEFGLSFQYPAFIGEPSIISFDKYASAGFQVDLDQLSLQFFVTGINQGVRLAAGGDELGFCGGLRNRGSVDEYCGKAKKWAAFAEMTTSDTCTRFGTIQAGDLSYIGEVYTTASKSFEKTCIVIDVSPVASQIAKKTGIGYYEIDFRMALEEDPDLIAIKNMLIRLALSVTPINSRDL